MNQSVLTPGGAIRPMFSNRDLLLLIWPLIAEQFLSLTVGMADIVMVGRLGEAAVSGVSLVDNIQILLNNLFSALSTGGAVVCAQYIGKNRPDLSSRAAKQLVYTVSVFSVTLAAAGLLFRNSLLPFVFGKIEADVMQEAQTYFLVMMFALPSIGMYNVCSALFRAQGNSRISMYIAALINVMNIGGNYLGIFVLNLGVLGAAVSTLCSRTVAAAVLFILLYRNKPVQGAEICHAGGSVPDGFRNTQAVSLRGILRIELDGRIIRHILGIGIPNGIENSMFQIGKIVVLSLIATFGTSAIAANAAANTIAGFEVLPGSAIGLAMLTVIGRCAGAGQLKEAERFTWKLMKITYICMLVLNAGILIFARPIISGLQRQNSLLIQLRALMDDKVLTKTSSPQPRGAIEEASRKFSHFFDGADAKSQYNIFEKNSWFLGAKLSPIAARISMKKLLDYQMAFANAFEELIKRPSSDESIMRDLFSQP